MVYLFKIINRLTKKEERKNSSGLSEWCKKIDLKHLLVIFGDRPRTRLSREVTGVLRWKVCGFASLQFHHLCRSMGAQARDRTVSCSPLTGRAPSLPTSSLTSGHQPFPELLLYTPVISRVPVSGSIQHIIF